MLLSPCIQTRYVAALYWAFTTLTTVGYGDISSCTVKEQLFSILTMFVGVTLYAIIISSISSIMTSFDASSQTHREQRSMLTDFIKTYSISKDLSRKLTKYLEVTLLNNPMRREKNHLEFLESLQLPASLHADVVLQVYAEILGEVPFFQERSSPFVAKALPKLQPFIAAKGDCIFQQDAPALEMYFVVNGKVQIKRGSLQLSVLEDGEYFGERACLLHGTRDAGAFCLEDSRMYTISKADLDELVRFHPDIRTELVSKNHQRREATKKMIKQASFLHTRSRSSRSSGGRRTMSFPARAGSLDAGMPDSQSTVDTTPISEHADDDFSASQFTGESLERGRTASLDSNDRSALSDGDLERRHSASATEDYTWRRSVDSELISLHDKLDSLSSNMERLAAALEIGNSPQQE